MKISLLFIVLPSLYAGLLGSPGEEVFPFLDAFQSAQSLALRKTGVAYRGGLQSLSSNPASLYNPTQSPSSLAFGWTHQDYTPFQGSILGRFSYRNSQIALGAYYKELAEITELNARGLETGISHNPYHYSFLIAHAYPLSKTITIGQSVHWVQSEIAQGSEDQSAYGISMNLGIHYQKTPKGIRFGLAAQQIGQNLRAYTKGGEVKRLTGGRFVGGYALRLPFFPRVLLMNDLSVPLYSDPQINFALKYTLHRSIEIYGSYTPTLDNLKNVYLAATGEDHRLEDVDEAWPFAFGSRFLFLEWSLDYGLQMNELLPWEHKFELGYHF